MRELRGNNSRPWFEAHRKDYERFYLEPAREFVVAAGALLREIAPGIRAEPRILGSIFRINRDTRFSKDKRPYKDHVDLWFWEGDRNRAVSGFFARVSPDFVGIGAGCHGFDRDQVGAFRRAVEDPVTGHELTMVAVGLTASGYQLRGGSGKGSDARTPDALARLLRHTALFVHVDAPADEARDGALLLEDCRRHWQQLAPLHRWLVDTVQGRAG